VPAVGAALDLGKAAEAYGAGSRYGFSSNGRRAEARRLPWLNDHATAFASTSSRLRSYGGRFEPADEGWGPRLAPKVIGHPRLAGHIAQSVIQDDFDLTIVNKMDLTTVSPCRSADVRAAAGLAVPVIPFAVNVV
jgi:protocatechuate 4,5-dioxygenase beta chain